MLTFLALASFAHAGDGAVVGWVLDGARPVAGASVVAEGGDQRIDVATDGEGSFQLGLAEGAWTLTVTLPGGASERFTVTTVADRSTEAVLALDTVPPPPPAPPEPASVVTGTLSGVVLDETGLPVNRAHVVVRGQPGETLTDDDGAFRIVVPVGAADVAVLRVGFAPQTLAALPVSAEGGGPIEVVLALEQTGDELTVASSPQPGGTVALLRERKESAAVTDVVGAEQMSRSGDTDAATALKRVNGLTVIGGKYVYVRGLGDRYSATLLNGSTLPSPEPEKRVVPLDLFPTALLDSVVIQKTFSPDIPAEFGGGVVQIRTRRIPEAPIFSVTLSGAWVGGTTFEQAQVGTSGPTDFFGFGNASRALPDSILTASERGPLKTGGIFSEDGFTAEEMEAFGEAIPSRWALSTRTLLPDVGLNVSAGRTWALGDVRLGALAGFVFSNAWDVEDGFQTLYSSGDAGLEERRHTTFVETSNRVRLGGMLSLGLSWGEDAGLTSTTLLNRNSTATALQYDADDPTGSNDTRGTRTGWEEQQLFVEQLELTVPVGPVTLDARYALALANQAEPDRREYTYLATDEGYVLSQRGSWNDLYYGSLADTNHDGGLDVTWRIPRDAGDLSLFAGAKVLARERSSAIRRFNFQFQGSDGIDLGAPIDEVLTEENIGAEDQGDLGYLELEENTSRADDYTAGQTILASYVMGDVPWTKRFRTLAGVRIERSRQTVETFELFDTDGTPIVADVTTVDALPAATLTFGIGPRDVPDAMQIRVGYGRTLSRPELRELSEVAYYDYRSGRLLYGNPDLQRATIENLDARWEWYPSAGESVSAGGFFKYFDQPIESVVAVSAVSGSVGTFANATSATNVGGELDLRKRLDFLDRNLFDFYVSGNVSVIASRVDLSETAGNQTSTDRPLQGQSPWVVNAQLSYENPDWRTNIAALYNVFGPRIVSVGTAGIPDVYELPVHRLDVVVTQGIGPHFSVRAKGSNLLGWPSREQTGDRISEETRDAWAAGLSVTWAP
ncbi:MAG: carboxypeptidase regulatory-like domain-containing protein [Pseudomonadota bacterium]|nr:carboxypeptidase regulatory-like domain-containing protein [Pseudomonadota bacterium]